MNITYTNGTTISKPFDAKEFAEAVADPSVAKAMIYKPGTIVEMSDRSYRVDSHGSLRRIRANER